MMRGEIWWVDFGVPLGSEVGFRRPAIILQNNVLNRSNLKTVVVLPLTTNGMYAEFPHNLLLSREVTGLSKDVVTQPHLIVHVDKMRVVEKVRRLSDAVIAKVLDGVVATLS